MSYFTGNCKKIRQNDIDGAMRLLVDSRAFQVITEENKTTVESLTEQMTQVLEVISVLTELANCYKTENYIERSIAEEDWTFGNFTSVETHYIKRFSIPYMYFRHELDKDSVWPIFFQGNIQNFFLGCLIIGFTTFKLDHCIKISDTKLEKVYDVFIEKIIDGNTRYILGGRGFYKSFVKDYARSTIYQDNSDNITLNFLQKQAVQNKHGLDYIQIGRSLGNLLNGIDKGYVSI